jgi:hypothetical protein
MADFRPPAQTEPALEDIERRNAEAFNRLQRLICRLEDFLRRDRQNPLDEPYEALQHLGIFRSADDSITGRNFTPTS